MEVKMSPLATQRAKMSPMNRAYWAELDQANELGRPVVYALGLVPQEIFRAADYAVFFGENFGASCAVARVSQELCEVAEADGFPMELCSYIRTNLGAMLSGRNPLGKRVPKPDVVAYMNFRCSAYAGWAKAIKQIYPDVQVLDIHVPPLWDGMTADDHRRAQRYVMLQIQDWIDFVDGFMGRRCDLDLLRQAVDNTGKGARACHSLQRTLRVKPAPISLIDIFFQLFPMLALRGRPEVEEYYQAAKSEVDQRIAAGFASVPNERIRIYWDGVAIWTRLANQFQKLASEGAALVASHYAFQMAEPLMGFDGAKPLESLADGLLRTYLNSSLQDKIDYAVRTIEEFDVNAIIAQISRSCKPNFFDEYGVKKGIVERTGLPYVDLQGDMADPRLYSEQELESRIEAFLARF